MKLKLTTTADNVLLVSDDGEAIAICNHVAHAEEIARAVNRDHLFEVMVETLTIFGSGEMGTILVDMVESTGLIIRIPDERVAAGTSNVRRLINSIDTILDSVKLASNKSPKRDSTKPNKPTSPD